MIPGFVKRTCISTAVAAALIAPYLYVTNQGAAIAFTVSTAWMIANLLTWSVLIVNAIRPGERSALVISLCLLIKFALLGAGIVALRIAAPMTRGEILAIVAGTTSVLAVATLKALGMKIMSSRSRALKPATALEVRS